jgi:hypothetical protein
VDELGRDGGGLAERGELLSTVRNEGFDVGVLTGGFFDVVGYT